MNVIYLCKISGFQATGNQIDIPKKIATDFFNVPKTCIEQGRNVGINICHTKDLTSFEIIELQPATNMRWSTKLNSFLTKNSDPLTADCLLVFEKIGRSYCVHTIKSEDTKYDPLLELFEDGEKHMLLSANLDMQSDNSSIVKPKAEGVNFLSQEYDYIAAIKTKPFLILGGFSGTGKSIEVKSLAYATCPCDGILNTSETSPGNYLLVSVKPNWHDASDITGFRSTVQKKYYVTDFMRFLVKARMYEGLNIPFFVCLDEMNLAPVEEYFADFLSVIESRKRKENGRIVTDALVPASVFNDTSYADDFNIFLDLGLKPVEDGMKADDIAAREAEGDTDLFVRQDLVDELKRDGLTIPQNVVIIGTVNMDDTTNSFSRKVIDRAMTFETVVGEFDVEYFKRDIQLEYVKQPRKGELFISDEVRATEMLAKGRFEISTEERGKIIDYINDINHQLEGTPFKISYRILNETILLYRAKQKIKEIVGNDFEKNVEFKAELNDIFDDILMQKVLPRIEGDQEKCGRCLDNLKDKAIKEGWTRSAEKLQFMIDRFGKDGSGFTSFWN